MPKRSLRAALLLAVLATTLVVPSAAPVECEPLAPAPELTAADPGGDCCAGDGAPCGCCLHLPPLLSVETVIAAGATPGPALWQAAGPALPSPDPRGVLHVPRSPAPALPLV